MEYRAMRIDEVEKIREIDATCFIKNAWRNINGGYAFGCFDNEQLVGYATMEGTLFGEKSKYLLLDQLFVSNAYRNQKVGTQLMTMCMDQAKELGAEKLYLCAGSSENTIAFYRKPGCVGAIEINTELFEEDPNDIQLELKLKDTSEYASVE